MFTFFYTAGVYTVGVKKVPVCIAYYGRTIAHLCPIALRYYGYAWYEENAPTVEYLLWAPLRLPKCCNITPRNVHERFQTLLTPVLTIFTDFLSAVVTSEIAQIFSLYGGGFLALKWQS